MPTGKPKCPVCQGKGTLTEDTQEYEFITRDPITSRCLLCNGEGWLNPSTRLPNGKRVFEVFRKENGTQTAGSGKRLNVSKKAAVNPEAVDTGVGYEPGKDKMDGAAAETKPCPPEKRRGRPKKAEAKEPYESPMFLEMPVRIHLWSSESMGKEPKLQEIELNPRLTKVLGSGIQFLIVTQKEPYYLDVFRLIRAQERAQGTWKQEDEERYVEALEQTIKTYKEVANG